MRKRFITIISIVCILILLIFGILIGRYWEGTKHKEPEITSSSIAAKLAQSSDLVTARLEYRGLVRYSQGDIAFITQKGFTMIYDATIKAGIDLSKANITVSDNSIQVVLPQPGITDIAINPDSIEFYDEKVALFNPQNKEDTVTAMQAAKEDAQNNASEGELLTTSKEQATRLIQELLSPIGTDTKREVTVEFQ